MYTFNASGKTQKGARRHISAPNEDALVVMPSHGLFMVVDGVSGAPSGNLAAQATAQAFATLASRSPPYREFLERVWLQANFAIDEIRQKNGILSRSPLAAASALWIERVGQQVRGFALQSGNTSLMVYYPTMHRVIYRSTPLVNDHMPTHLFGNTDNPPVITPVTFPANCIAVLATDGITNTLKDGDLAAMLHYAVTPQNVVASLLRLATYRGESDDMTAIVVRLSSP